MFLAGDTPSRILLIWLLLTTATVHGQAVSSSGAGPQLEILADSCPSETQLRQQLAPVLPPDATGAVRITVRDRDAAYLVQVGAAQRQLQDAARDCAERARVAAVFIALNLETSSPPPAPPAPAPRPKPETARADLQLFAAGSYSAAADAAVLGGGVGVGLGTATLRLDLDLALVSPVRLALDPSGSVQQGEVVLVRLPASWTATYLLQVGALRVGPTLGLALDGLRMRGGGVEQPRTQWRLNPGALVGLRALLGLDRGLSIRLRAALRAFPLVYELSVEPLGSLGRTPRLWFGLDLGLGVEL